MGSSAADALAGGGDRPLRGHLRAQVDVHVAHAAARQVGDEHLDRDLVAQARVLDVLHDAHDLHVGRSAGVAAETHWPTERALGVAEEAPGEFLVDDDHARGPVVVLRSVLDLVGVLPGEVAPGQDGHAEGGEVAGLIEFM